MTKRKYPIPLFYNKKQLKAWLTQTNDGREIVEELMATANPSPWRPLLAVQKADCVELYGTGISLKAITQVNANTPQGEVYAEQLMEASLSEQYRELMWPSRCTADKPGKVGVVAPQRLSVGEYEWRLAFQDNIQMIRSMEDRNEERNSGQSGAS